MDKNSTLKDNQQLVDTLVRTRLNCIGLALQYAGDNKNIPDILAKAKMMAEFALEGKVPSEAK